MSMCRQKGTLTTHSRWKQPLNNRATFLFFFSFEVSMKGLLIFQPNSINLSYPSRIIFVMKMGYISICLFTALRKALLILCLYQGPGGMEVLEFYCRRYFVKCN